MLIQDVVLCRVDARNSISSDVHEGTCASRFHAFTLHLGRVWRNAMMKVGGHFISLMAPASKREVA